MKTPIICIPHGHRFERTRSTVMVGVRVAITTGDACVYPVRYHMDWYFMTEGCVRPSFRFISRLWAGLW